MAIPKHIRPISTSEFYLEDIAASLREISLLLQAAVALQMGQAVVPPSTSEGKPSLPEGFPGRAELEAAGISALADVPRTAKRLKEIHGIGPATATEILKAIGK